MHFFRNEESDKIEPRYGGCHKYDGWASDWQPIKKKNAYSTRYCTMGGPKQSAKDIQVLYIDSFSSRMKKTILVFGIFLLLLFWCGGFNMHFNIWLIYFQFSTAYTLSSSGPPAFVYANEGVYDATIFLMLFVDYFGWHFRLISLVSNGCYCRLVFCLWCITTKWQQKINQKVIFIAHKGALFLLQFTTNITTL